MNTALLNTIIDKLDRIERLLDKQSQPHEYSKDNTPQPYIQETKCPKCGLVFAGVINYYCSQNDCPTFLSIS